MLLSFQGEYLKDLDKVLLPQDPLLNNKVPRPLIERGHCNGVWGPLEQSWYDKEEYNNRDCGHYDPVDYLQPLSRLSSKVSNVPLLWLVTCNILDINSSTDYFTGNAAW